MTRTLGLRDLGELDAGAWSGVTTQLLHARRPLLAVARLSGGVVSLGRYQRAESALTPAASEVEVVRRPTGGRALALGDGLLAVALAVPHRSWLVDASPEALPAAKFLNRGVRGLLSGLAALGVGAYYFGRDFVTVESAQAGHLSFEITADGALLECILAAGAHWSLPAELDGLPARQPQRGIPGPGQIPQLEPVTSTALLDALARGYSERSVVTCEADRGDLPEPTSLEAPTRARWSSLREIPIGFVQVGADTRDGMITGCSFCGDFEADSPGVAAAEAAMIGSHPTLAEIAPRLNGVYHSQRHTVLGVTSLNVWAEALIEACAA